MSRIYVALLSLLALLPALVNAGVMLTIRQNAAGQAFVVSLNMPAGTERTVSALTWQYRWPLVQATYDAVRARFLVTTFIGANTTLFAMDKDSLTLRTKWQTTTDAFFDLQHMTGQDTVYGIHVEGTYGRVLSNFTLGADKVTAEHLIKMPMFWYVNASTVDHATNRYFAILNNFTGTKDQKLVVADFRSKETVVNTKFIDLYNWLTINFIAWSAPKQTLFGLGYRQRTATDRVPFFVAFDLEGGRWVPLEIIGDNFDASWHIGPIAADERGHLWAMFKNNGQWKLVDVDLTGERFRLQIAAVYDGAFGDFGAIAYGA